MGSEPGPGEGRLVSHFLPGSPRRSPQRESGLRKQEKGPDIPQVSFNEEKIAQQKKEAQERKVALRSPEREKAEAAPVPPEPGRLNRKQRRAAFMKHKRQKESRTGPKGEVRETRQGRALSPKRRPEEWN